MWSRFKACLGYAKRLGYIDRVPFKGLDNPRGCLLYTSWKNYKADSINITISLTGYLTFQKNYNVRLTIQYLIPSNNFLSSSTLKD